MNSDLSALIQKHVMGWSYLAKSKQDYDGLVRLCSDTYPRAKSAWVALYKRKLKDKKHSFWEVVSSVGRSAVVANLPASSKRTGKEMRDARDEAIHHASRLIQLIEQHASLRIMGEDLIPYVERAALHRLLHGLISMTVNQRKSWDGRPYHQWFPAEIESKLDEVQARDFPDCKDLTTEDAYKELKWTTIEDEHFLGRLQQFVVLAKKFRHIDVPIVPRPNADNADHHALAVEICHTLNYYYGQPLFEICGDFVSVVFDADVDGEVVKKWWKRRSEPVWPGDSSGENSDGSVPDN